MDSESVRAEIRAYIVDNFLFGNEADLSDDQSLLEYGLIDSTGILELVGFLEERFAIQVPDEEMIPDNMDSIDRVVGYVGTKLAG
jgi:acyl carrier protein